VDPESLGGEFDLLGSRSTIGQLFRPALAGEDLVQPLLHRRREGQCPVACPLIEPLLRAAQPLVPKPLSAVEVSPDPPQVERHFKKHPRVRFDADDHLLLQKHHGCLEQLLRSKDGEERDLLRQQPLDLGNGFALEVVKELGGPSQGVEEQRDPRVVATH
jgi:hypothetical protein